MRKLSNALSLLTICFALTGCSLLGLTSTSKSTAETAPSSTTTSAAPSSANMPKEVVLLLPLQGPLGNAGQAVRDGFITAYNNDNSAAKPVHVTVIDSSSGTIEEAYKKAVKADADVIVGPLSKTNVQTLVQNNSISVPTLALNYLDINASAPSRLYQFGLSPLDEAQQAVALARQNGAQNAVILAPNDSWGQTLAQSYQTAWQGLGGKVVTKLYFSNDSKELNQQIHNLVNKYQQKFDVILLAASPTMARQIKPLLKFYYAGDIPVYATSLVYSGTPQPAFDTDLNGVTFCDAPWVLRNDSVNNKLRQQIALFWSANYKQNARLYALGIDAYQVVKNLVQLSSSQQSIAGATGNLSLNDQRRIVRQLTCAKFVSGIPDSLKTNNTVTSNTTTPSPSASDDAASNTDPDASAATTDDSATGDTTNANTSDDAAATDDTSANNSTDNNIDELADE